MASKKSSKGQGTLSSSSWSTKPKSTSTSTSSRVETKASIKADLKRRESEKEQAILNSNSTSRSTSSSSSSLKDNALKRSASASSFGSDASKSKKEKVKVVQVESKEAFNRERLNVYNPGYNKHWAEVSKAMGLPKCQPIHAEGETRIEQMLRVFDLNPKYGPCSGLSRLERWERAESLGDEPPLEIREILETREGNRDMSQSVLHAVGIF